MQTVRRGTLRNHLEALQTACTSEALLTMPNRAGHVGEEPCCDICVAFSRTWCVLRHVTGLSYKVCLQIMRAVFSRPVATPLARAPHLDESDLSSCTRLSRHLGTFE